jgi:hypothetical protein
VNPAAEERLVKELEQIIEEGGYFHKRVWKYRMSSVFMSVFQDLIPEVIPSQKCRMNIGLILSGCRATDI